MPMTVRNNEPNTTVFAKNVDGNLVRIIFTAKGQPDDTQRVPDAFADDIDFLNALDQQVLEVIECSDPALKEKIDREVRRSGEHRHQRQQRQQAEIESVMDRSADKSMFGAECIAPQDGRPQLKCGRQILVKRTEVNAKPPLCQQHEFLLPTFYLAEAGSKGSAANGADPEMGREGVVRREWKQVEIAAR